jgi:hypothetical protein
MAIVRDVQLSHFSGRIGHSFAVAVRGHLLSLTLDAAQDLPGSVRPGGGFRLEFTGPSNPVLKQGIFPFEIGKECFEIFVVPLAHDISGTRYEAIFY